MKAVSAINYLLNMSAASFSFTQSFDLTTPPRGFVGGPKVPTFISSTLCSRRVQQACQAVTEPMGPLGFLFQKLLKNNTGVRLCTMPVPAPTPSLLFSSLLWWILQRSHYRPLQKQIELMKALSLSSSSLSAARDIYGMVNVYLFRLTSWSWSIEPFMFFQQTRAVLLVV